MIVTRPSPYLHRCIKDWKGIQFTDVYATLTDWHIGTHHLHTTALLMCMHLRYLIKIVAIS